MSFWQVSGKSVEFLYISGRLPLLHRWYLFDIRKSWRKSRLLFNSIFDLINWQYLISSKNDENLTWSRINLDAEYHYFTFIKKKLNKFIVCVLPVETSWKELNSGNIYIPMMASWWMPGIRLIMNSRGYHWVDLWNNLRSAWYSRVWWKWRVRGI